MTSSSKFNYFRSCEIAVLRIIHWGRLVVRMIHAIVCCLIASPALAAQTAPAPTATPAAAAPAVEKPVCRRIQVTGSNMGKRECHTRAEWRVIDSREDPTAARALQNRPVGS